MPNNVRWSLAEIEHRLCDITSESLGIPRREVTPRSSFLDDLHFDSLDLVELYMEIEETFGVTLDHDSPDPVFKTIFTRHPFLMSDLAEAIFIQQGTNPTPQRDRRGRIIKPPASIPTLFTQLGGRWEPDSRRPSSLFEPLGSEGPVRYFRRASDGMRCARLPEARVEIGCDDLSSLADATPKHEVELDAFLIDAEPVSTTAYCRFLNSTRENRPEALRDWFALAEEDHRQRHLLVERVGADWRPVRGTERVPMILVSWYGANAYSLWANGRDWKRYRDDSDPESGRFLPSEAQWEYASRGTEYRPFPWGDEPPAPERMVYDRHRRSAEYLATTLPMADVNAALGVSPFGLRHMAGNVWQWCRDWYDGAFYRQPEARRPNPLNRKPTGVRSERGGSWIGSADLCRSSYRRGRPTAARGRCLGFRCVGIAEDA